MRALALSFFLLISTVVAAFAQSGQIPNDTMLGNISGHQAPAAPLTTTQICNLLGGCGGGGGSVSSVFGRTGAVTAQSGDYTANQISGLNTFLASPPAIGGSAPNTGSFTTLTSNSTTNIITGPFQFNGNNIGLPNQAATLTFQLGTFIPGDCIQVAAGVPGQNGGLADSGVSGCSGGGGGGGSVAHTQDFVGGVNFTPGVTTALTLSSIPQSANTLVITFDGVTQAHNTWGVNLTNGIVSFDAAIPNSVQVVEAQWLTTAVGVITGLTGDVTASGSGSVTATIAANAVTYAKFQQVAADSLVGNPTGSLANAEGITLGTTLNFSGTTLNCTTATTGQLGCVKPDGTTITIAGGIISSNASATSITIDTTTVIGGVNGDCLFVSSGTIGNQSCGTATSIAVGTTNITSGTSGDFLYNNGGVLGNKVLATTDLPKFNQAMASLTALRFGGI